MRSIVKVRLGDLVPTKGQTDGDSRSFDKPIEAYEGCDGALRINNGHPRYDRYMEEHGADYETEVRLVSPLYHDSAPQALKERLDRNPRQG